MEPATKTHTQQTTTKQFVNHDREKFFSPLFLTGWTGEPPFPVPASGECVFTSRRKNARGMKPCHLLNALKSTHTPLSRLLAAFRHTHRNTRLQQETNLILFCIGCQRALWTRLIFFPCNIKTKKSYRCTIPNCVLILVIGCTVWQLYMLIFLIFYISKM